MESVQGVLLRTFHFPSSGDWTSTSISRTATGNNTYRCFLRHYLHSSSNYSRLKHLRTATRTSRTRTWSRTWQDDNVRVRRCGRRTRPLGLAVVNLFLRHYIIFLRSHEGTKLLQTTHMFPRAQSYRFQKPWAKCHHLKLDRYWFIAFIFSHFRIDRYNNLSILQKAIFRNLHLFSLRMQLLKLVSEVDIIRFLELSSCQHAGLCYWKDVEGNSTTRLPGWPLTFF